MTMNYLNQLNICIIKCRHYFYTIRSVTSLHSGWSEYGTTLIINAQSVQNITVAPILQPLEPPFNPFARVSIVEADEANLILILPFDVKPPWKSISLLNGIPIKKLDVS